MTSWWRSLLVIALAAYLTPSSDARLGGGKEDGIATNGDNLQRQDHSTDGTASILIGVLTSRVEFVPRVSAIYSSWGDPNRLPRGVAVRFFVGRPVGAAPAEDDGAYLARSVGMSHPGSVVVMDVDDVEDPPVRKVGAMIRYLDRAVRGFAERGSPSARRDDASRFDWAMKCDDVALVNVEALAEFLSGGGDVDATQHAYYGAREWGEETEREGLVRAGMVRPYCRGGSGYVMSRPTLRVLAESVHVCVAEADESPLRDYVWHEDVMVGMCVAQNVGVGCWNVPGTFSMHPFEHKGDMFLEYLRIQSIQNRTRGV